jgi:predicted nuclease with TOPRIM domain
MYTFVIVENEKLKEERDKYHQESFELKDQNQSLNEKLDRSRDENTKLREQIQNITLRQQMAEDATDGTTSGNRTFPQQGGGLKGNICTMYVENEFIFI